MANSYENINYSIRPAKAIERKMMCDVFRKLTGFGKIEAYTYIGFGSTYFTDFSLFHKQLGISEMISIEKDVENKARFEFNRPYGCINLEFGDSNDILPSLNWDEKLIVWLDYDGKLDQSVLTDIHFVCENITPGSMFVFSVNAMSDNVNEDRYALLEGRIGSKDVPLGINEDDLTRSGIPKTYYRISINRIQDTLVNRNGSKSNQNSMVFKQLFHFIYSDGATMLTIGGIFYEKSQENIVNGLGFSDFSFIRDGKDPYRIEVPNLTYREIRHLDTHLPDQSGEVIPNEIIPESDWEKYKELYRYFPTFTEAEI